MTDFIIVGQGLAATVLMHTFRQHHLSFNVVANNQLSNCSAIAAGIWNPVVFKRMTKSWKAEELVPHLNTFYSECESLLATKIVTQRPIIKPFVEEQEKKLWQKKSGEELNSFIDPVIYDQVPQDLAHCIIPNGYGRVLQSGNLNTAHFLSASSQFYHDLILHETFDYSVLEIFEDHVRYKSLIARNIIFCEGYCVKDNPFFNWIPLKPAKGEVLTIEAEDLKLKNQVFNKNGFLMDIAPGTYKVGATYEWAELSDEPTDKGRRELEAKLREMMTCKYNIVDHQAGIRPSSIDRRPIIGAHPHHLNLYVFNGLGTKGVMLAPFFAKNFVNFFLQKEAIDPEVQVNRFYNLYAR